MKKRLKKVDEETLKFWNDNVYWGCFKELSRHIKVSERTLYKYFNLGKCPESNIKLITLFFENRLNIFKEKLNGNS